MIDRIQKFIFQPSQNFIRGRNISEKNVYVCYIIITLNYSQGVRNRISCRSKQSITAFVSRGRIPVEGPCHQVSTSTGGVTYEAHVFGCMARDDAKVN